MTKHPSRLCFFASLRSLFSSLRMRLRELLQPEITKATKRTADERAKVFLLNDDFIDEQARVLAGLAMAGRANPDVFGSDSNEAR